MKNHKKHRFVSSLTPKQKRWISILSGVVILIFFGLISWFIGRPMIKFIREPEQFRDWVDGHGIWGKIIFIGMVIIQVMLAFIPGEPLEFGAGYAFGAAEGAILCEIGALLGGIIVFQLVRKLGVRFVEIFFPIEKIRSMRFLSDTKKRDLLTFIVMFIPGTPKDLICYFVGLTDMPLVTWICICAVARIPSIVTSTIAGSALGKQNFITAIVVSAVTLAVSAVGLLIYRQISRHRAKKHLPEEPETDEETDESAE